MTDAALRRVALHESGHALVAWLLPQQPDVVKLSVTPRGCAAGFTQQLGREALDMPTDLSLFTDLCVLLAGRLAEPRATTDSQRGHRTTINAPRKLPYSSFFHSACLKALGYLHTNRRD
ncbi:Peptidase family M41 [Trypanosoma brucei equiperdum]|uniref:Peptidase family M41 n=1 Tax=Trypanosoma brucei equiperdum TaxID=630700 RepID=A0A3L6KZZ1_9TRYP|nr:Peptidase family M41 [Trypanosoma brucei equiperdum]